jgi:hypothetical protein
MNGTSYIDRLVASAERIARHCDFPGKEQAVEQCMEDIEELMLTGRISVEQRDMLRNVLVGSSSHVA